MNGGAAARESGGYLVKVRFANQGGEKPWENLAGWIETHGEEGTQGFLLRVRI